MVKTVPPVVDPLDHTLVHVYFHLFDRFPDPTTFPSYPSSVPLRAGISERKVRAWELRVLVVESSLWEERSTGISSLPAACHAPL